MDPTRTEGTRRYESPVRREQSAATRGRIIAAGCDLVRDLSSWDWRGVTVRAVAARAGVHERTVHRHFPTEGDLRAALLQRLVEESGVTVEGLRLEELPAHVEQLFSYLATFSSSTPRQPDAVLQALDERRKAAILATVSESADGLTAEAQRAVAAMVDVLWSLDSYRRLTNGWGFDGSEAAGGVNWVLELISEAVQQGRGPGSSDADG